jgi:ankyrin repeat protein
MTDIPGSFASNALDEETVRAAIYTRSIPYFKSLLAKDPSIINMQFDRRGTPLIVACMSKQSIEYLRMMLEAGADPNQEPDAAAYPLAFVAAFYDDPGAIDLLLDYGAKLEKSAALGWATLRGNEVMLRHLLLRGADPRTDTNEIGRRETALHHAASKGYVSIAKILLDHGAQTSEVDIKGKTALAHAEEKQQNGEDRTEMIRLLKEYER